jgi:hypothetical protein
MKVGTKVAKHMACGDDMKFDEVSMKGSGEVTLLLSSFKNNDEQILQAEISALVSK